MFLLEQKTKKTHWFKNSSSGVTLLEVLLVTVAIGILVGLVFAALNPVRFFQDNRDNQREVHLHDLQVAFAQLLAEEEGVFPAGITTVPKEICDTGKTPGSAIPQPDCGNMVNLSMLVPTYISQIPKDPQGGIAASIAPEAHAQAVGTGYFISKGEANRLVIQAPRSENRPIGIGKIYNPYSLEFDGSSGYVDTDVLAPENGIATMSYWWRMEEEDEEQQMGIRPGPLFYLGARSNNRIFSAVGDTWEEQGEVNVLQKGNWYHLVLTADGNVARTYLNGKFVGSYTYSWSGTPTSFRIGSRGESNNRHMKGVIDNVRIYNRALSEQEIQNLYNGIHIPEGLVGWWNFNEGEGTTTEDLSGNENHGTLHGGVTWTEDTP